MINIEMHVLNSFHIVFFKIAQLSKSNWSNKRKISKKEKEFNADQEYIYCSFCQRLFIIVFLTPLLSFVVNTVLLLRQENNKDWE